MTLALFDFDGTLTKRDTLFAFLRYANGGFRFFAGVLILSPVIAAYVIGILGAEKAKSMLLSWFFKGESREKIEAAGESFCRERLPELMNEKIFGQMKTHLQNGDEVCIASASADAWLMPFARQYHIRCICTELEYDRENKFTGRFRTPNCKGEEKKKRICATIDLSRYSKVIAYGNSGADLPMLELAHEKHLLR